MAGNLKLDVTEYSRQIYGPKGFSHPSDDNDDPETTPNYQSRKRC